MLWRVEGFVWDRFQFWSLHSTSVSRVSKLSSIIEQTSFYQFVEPAGIPCLGVASTEHNSKEQITRRDCGQGLELLQIISGCEEKSHKLTFIWQDFYHSVSCAVWKLGPCGLQDWNNKKKLEKNWLDNCSGTLFSSVLTGGIDTEDSMRTKTQQWGTHSQTQAVVWQRVCV